MARRNGGYLCHVRIEGVVHLINWSSELAHGGVMYDGTTPCFHWFSVDPEHNTEAEDGELVERDAAITCFECWVRS